MAVDNAVAFHLQDIDALCMVIEHFLQQGRLLDELNEAAIAHHTEMNLVQIAVNFPAPRRYPSGCIRF
eukprot:7877017-Prorocentrum_lima.AAC.1